MSKKENQVVSITNISESGNIKASVSKTKPLGTHVITKVSNNHIVYIGDHVELIKNPESTPIKLTKSAKNEISTVRDDDRNRNISSFPTAKNRESDLYYPSDNIRQQFKKNSLVETATADEIAEQDSLENNLALIRKIHQQKARQIQQLERAEELRKIQYEIHEMDNKINQSRVPLYSEHYEHEIPNKREPFFNFDTHGKYNQHCLNSQIDTFRAKRLSKKFKRLDIVRNPRNTINYFEEELYHEGIFNEDEKYNYLIGLWPREEVSDYYRMIDRNARNYDSLRKFCISRDNVLTEILDEVPQWKVSTHLFVKFM